MNDLVTQTLLSVLDFGIDLSITTDDQLTGLTIRGHMKSDGKEYSGEVQVSRVALKSAREPDYEIVNALNELRNKFIVRD